MSGGDGKEIYRGWTIVVKVGAWPQGNASHERFVPTVAVMPPDKIQQRFLDVGGGPHSCFAPTRFVMDLPSQGPLSTCSCGHRTVRGRPGNSSSALGAIRSALLRGLTRSLTLRDCCHAVIASM